MHLNKLVLIFFLKNSRHLRYEKFTIIVLINTGWSGARMEQEVRVCAVQSAWFFFKFVTEPIGISFVIIKIDAYWLRSVFWPIAVQFDQLGLISLVSLIWNNNNLFLFFIFIKKICSTYKKICSTYKKICSTKTL